MFLDDKCTKPTKIKAGDLVLFDEDGTLAIAREELGRCLCWNRRNGGDDQFLLAQRRISKVETLLIIAAICGVLDLEYKEEEARSGERARYRLVGGKTRCAGRNQVHTERLLLNTNPEERVFIQDLLERSDTSSAGELLRLAFTQYLAFHKHVRKGGEIIVRSAGGKGLRSIFIPAEWKDPAYRGIEEGVSEGKARKASTRKLLEIRLSHTLKIRLQKFVARGFAPSLTALAGASLQIYASVLAAQEEGGEIRARCTDGTEVVLVG
ncbi:MAG: hypothetical protein Q7R88_00385 [bacterium]|nr:hypothetical protein [bacterium]